jgi:hypothetical protein
MLESCAKAGHKGFVRLIQGACTGYDDVVEIIPGKAGVKTANDSLQAAAHPIACDGTAELLGDREAEPRAARLRAVVWDTGLRLAPCPSLNRVRDPLFALKQECLRAPSRSATNPFELGGVFQRTKAHTAHPDRSVLEVRSILRLDMRSPGVVPGRPDIRRRDACGLWPADARSRARRPGLPSACGSRGAACARAGSADRSVSRQILHSAPMPQRGFRPLDKQMHGQRCPRARSPCHIPVGPGLYGATVVPSMTQSVLSQGAAGAVSQMEPSVRNAAISAAERPSQPPYTSSLCWPTFGDGVVATLSAP